MNNPLNELSDVYNQQIAEGCGCDEKKKVKLKVEVPGTKRPDGGDGAAPNDGKNLLATGNVPMGGSGAKRRVSKYAVEPLSSEEYTPVDEGHKQFPLDRVKKKIAKKESEGKSVDAHAMKAVKNFSTKASDFSKDKGDEAKAKSKQFKSFEKKDRGDQDYHMRNKNPKSAVKSMLSAVQNEKKAKALKAVSNAGKRMEGYAPGDVDQKVGAVTSIPKKEQDAARERLLAKAKKKREMKEGHCDVEGVECSPTEKKKDAKKMKKESTIYSNWREDWEYLDEYASGITGYGSGDSENNLGKTKAKTDDKANQKIVEKNIKNKIKINPPQGMNEAFNEIGGQLVEMYEIELDENTEEQDRRLQNQKMVLAKKQDNLNRQKEQRNQQAKLAAAKTSQNNNSTAPMAEETEEEKKKRELMARTKEHDDKRSGKLAESDFPKDAPSIKDAKAKTKTFVKRYPGLGYAPTIKDMKEGRVLNGVLSTIRSKNGMGQISSKGKDKLQDKKDKTMCGEGLSIDDQMKLSRDAAKNRNPNPDHKAIRGKMLRKPLPKDTRTDSQKMTDAVGKPRMGSSD